MGRILIKFGCRYEINLMNCEKITIFDIFIHITWLILKDFTFGNFTQETVQVSTMNFTTCVQRKVNESVKLLRRGLKLNAKANQSMTLTIWESKWSIISWWWILEFHRKILYLWLIMTFHERLVKFLSFLRNLKKGELTSKHWNEFYKRFAFWEQMWAMFKVCPIYVDSF